MINIIIKVFGTCNIIIKDVIQQVEPGRMGDKSVPKDKIPQTHPNPITSNPLNIKRLQRDNKLLDGLRQDRHLLPTHPLDPLKRPVLDPLPHNGPLPLTSPANPSATKNLRTINKPQVGLVGWGRQL